MAPSITLRYIPGMPNAQTGLDLRAFLKALFGLSEPAKPTPKAAVMIVTIHPPQPKG
jgi:hypothetical protein